MQQPTACTMLHSLESVQLWGRTQFPKATGSSHCRRHTDCGAPAVTLTSHSHLHSLTCSLACADSASAAKASYKLAMGDDTGMNMVTPSASAMPAQQQQQQQQQQQRHAPSSSQQQVQAITRTEPLEGSCGDSPQHRMLLCCTAYVHTCLLQLKPATPVVTMLIAQAPGSLCSQTLSD
jgi:hypothetical protein